MSASMSTASGCGSVSARASVPSAREVMSCSPSSLALVQTMRPVGSAFGFGGSAALAAAEAAERCGGECADAGAMATAPSARTNAEVDRGPGGDAIDGHGGTPFVGTVPRGLRGTSGTSAVSYSVVNASVSTRTARGTRTGSGVVLSRVNAKSYIGPSIARASCSTRRIRSTATRIPRRVSSRVVGLSRCRRSRSSSARSRRPSATGRTLRAGGLVLLAQRKPATLTTSTQ